MAYTPRSSHTGESVNCLNNISFVQHDFSRTLAANVRRYVRLALIGATAAIVLAIPYVAVSAPKLWSPSRVFMVIFALAVTVLVISTLRLILGMSSNRQQLSARYLTLDRAIRRADALAISKAWYMRGYERVPVFLTYTRDGVYAEGPTVALAWLHRDISEVEIDSELTSGRSIEPERVVRLRTRAGVIEFVVLSFVAKWWKTRTAPPESELYNLHMLA